MPLCLATDEACANIIFCDAMGSVRVRFLDFDAKRSLERPNVKMLLRRISVFSYYNAKTEGAVAYAIWIRRNRQCKMCGCWPAAAAAAGDGPWAFLALRAAYVRRAWLGPWRRRHFDVAETCILLSISSVRLAWEFLHVPRYICTMYMYV